MSIENNLNNISKDSAIQKESFKSIFGLTLEVEKEIIFSIFLNIVKKRDSFHYFNFYTLLIKQICSKDYQLKNYIHVFVF